jgi:hypothetical protein
MLEDALLLLSDINASGLNTRELKNMYELALQKFGSKDYKGVIEIYEDILESKEAALKAQKLIKEVEEKIADAEYRGLETPMTGRLVFLSKAALSREEFSTALKRANDALVTFALETVGKFNFWAFVRNNWIQILIGMIVFAMVAIFVTLRLKLSLINYNLKKLKKEEQVLIGLVKRVQKECFEEGKLSMDEYAESMMQYEKRLSDIIKKNIEYGSKKSNLLKLFKGEIKKLETEKKRLVELIKETQRLYLDEHKLETKIYQNRINSYSERLVEVEERIATLEAKKAMKKAYKKKGKGKRR